MTNNAVTEEERMLIDILKKAQDIACRVNTLENQLEELTDKINGEFSYDEEQRIINMIEEVVDERELASETYVDDIINEAKNDLDLRTLIDDALERYLTKKDFDNKLLELRERVSGDLVKQIVCEVKGLTGLIINPQVGDRLDLIGEVERGLSELASVDRVCKKFETAIKDQEKMKKTITTLKEVFAYASNAFQKEETGG